MTDFYISYTLRKNKSCYGYIMSIIISLLKTEAHLSNIRGELSYLAPLGSENIPAPYFKQCSFRGWGGIPPSQTESNTTPPSPKTEI